MYVTVIKQLILVESVSLMFAVVMLLSEESSPSTG